MKCLSKKILCYILIGLLTFSVTSTVYYKSVHAMEWVGGALAFEEALKWLLAAIGITATAGMTDAYWDTYGDDFTDYAIENGATQTEVAEWQLKACQGVIDKGSVVWSKFKAWASDLVSGSNNVVELNNSDNIINYFNNTFNTSFPLYSSNIDVYAFSFLKSKNSLNYYELILITDNTSFIINSSGESSNLHGYKFSSNSQYWAYQGFRYSIDSSLLSNYDFYLSSNFINNSSYTLNFIDISSSGTSDTNFDSVATNVNDLDVISSDGVDEDNPEVTVPMPGVSDSDNEASKDAYQDIIDAINDGTITQEQGVEQIQEILKIITYDTVTDEVVPPQQNDDGTDKTKDDALKENKENMGFTLGGLEAVFPFCIPFDIYAFMTLLVAEPECPEFDFPVKSVNGEVEEIHIDLEPFEPVAVVVRYCFDFLFIIGLAMLTRSLIGGGSSD